MWRFKAKPLSFDTLRSGLWAALDEEHHEEVSLDRAEMRAIKAWIDLNCPLSPNYIYRANRPESHPPDLTAIQ